MIRNYNVRGNLTNGMERNNMVTGMKTWVVMFNDNRIECLQLILAGWIRRLDMLIAVPGIDLRSLLGILSRIPPLAGYIKKSIQVNKLGLGRYKGLLYEINKEAVDVTRKFCDKNLKTGDSVVEYYNKAFDTVKFGLYIRKELSRHIFTLLNYLHEVKLSQMTNNEILISATRENIFTVRYMEEKYGVKYRVKWITPFLRNPCSFLFYYRWLCMEFIRRGVIFNRPRKSYRISREVVWGFDAQTLRDDIFIDNICFKKSDMLVLYMKNKEPGRTRAFEQAKEKGFDTAVMPDLKININENFFHILFFYFIVPLKTYLRLLLKRRSYLLDYFLLFHRRCFSVEILTNLYEIGCNLSCKDWGDVGETIVLNKYNTKNVLFHWSDLVHFKDHLYAFLAHDVYYVWGDAHYNFHSENFYIDRKVNTGCIFKKTFNRAKGKKEEIIRITPGIKEDRKTVAFFDTSFGDSTHFTEGFFLEYLAIIRRFCAKNPGINVLLKAKSRTQYDLQVTEARFDRFKKIWDGLERCGNFIFRDGIQMDVTEAIAISDVCVNMGLNSPATIALICGKEGLYYDNTDNEDHPFFKKYRDVIVFDNERFLSEQITNILEGKFRCRDVISEQEIRGLDAFTDDKALERIKRDIHVICGGKNTGRDV